MGSDSEASPSLRIDIISDPKKPDSDSDDDIVIEINPPKSPRKGSKSKSKTEDDNNKKKGKKDDKSKKSAKSGESKKSAVDNDDDDDNNDKSKKKKDDKQKKSKKDKSKKSAKSSESKKSKNEGDDEGENEGEEDDDDKKDDQNKDKKEGEEEEEEEVLENVGHENTTSATIKNERRADCTCTEYVENQFKKGGLCTRCLHPKAAHVDGHCEALSLFFFKRIRRRKKKRDSEGNLIVDDANPEYEYFDGDISQRDDDEYSYEYVDEDGKVVDPPTPLIKPKITIEPPPQDKSKDDDDDDDDDIIVVADNNNGNDDKKEVKAEPILIIDSSSSSSSDDDDNDGKEEKKEGGEEKKEEKEEDKKDKFVEIFDDGYYDEEGKFHPYNNEGYDEFGGYYDDDGYYCDDNGFYDDNGDYHEFKSFDECKEFITQTDNLEDGFNAELHTLEKEMKETEGGSGSKAKKAEKKKKKEKEREELEAARKRQQKRKELAEKKRLAKLEKKKKKKEKKSDDNDDDYDDDDDDDDEDYYNDMDDEDKEEVDKIKKVSIVINEGASGVSDLSQKIDSRLAGRWCAEEDLPDREEPELKLIMSERVDEDDERELREEEIKKQNAEARRRARDMREKAILEKKERLNRQKKLREYEPPGKDNSSPFDMISFVRKTVPDKTSLYKARVIKTRRGCLAMIYEGYKDEDREREILYAKKISPSRFLVSVNEDFSKSSEGVVAELLVGQNMEYTTLKELDYTEYTDDRNELIGVWRLPYKSSNEPMRLNVIIPNKFLITYTYWKSTDGVLVHMLKAKETDDLTVLETKKPIWDDIHNQRILNFHGRVKSSSIKNIQLVDPKETRKVLLQFGRVDHSTFILDYKHPFSAVQAFAVAITMIS